VATTTLVIVERAHRGTLEQQYAHVLWLVRALCRQAPITLLLRGRAAVYALDLAPARAPGPAGWWGCLPDYQASLRSLTNDGSELLVSTGSLDELRLGDHPLLPGVVPVSDDEMAALWVAHDRIWYL
jgi:hypothetical protein